METVEVLKKSEIFRGLTDEQIGVIEKMVSRKTFEPGAVICKQDQKSDQLYVIEDGLAGIVLEVGPLSQRQVQTAGKYDVFAWSAMIEPYKYTATVKAVKKTAALAINSKDLIALCKSRPEIGCLVSDGIARIVAKRLREAYTQLLGVTGC